MAKCRIRTVRRYLRLANPAISTAGSEEGADRKPAISIAGVGAGRMSRCERLAEGIAAKLEAGLSARRIYQDLVEQNDFRDSYQSVQRFVGEVILNPFVAGRLRVLWPAATFPDLQLKFRKIVAAAAVIHRLTLRVVEALRFSP